MNPVARRVAYPTDGRSMIKLIDRQLILGYFKSYLVCLTSLLSLYVVVDLFTNLDDFTHHHKTFLGVLQHVAAYYGFRLTKIFDQLCEPIVLLAAMFTMAWMQRCNEQFPLLSAGVSTRRIVLPVLVCSARHAEPGDAQSGTGHPAGRGPADFRQGRPRRRQGPEHPGEML